MNRGDALQLIRQTHSLVLTTREFSMLGNISLTFASQMLRRLAAKQKLQKLYRGLWADTQNSKFNLYLPVKYLTRPHPAAVSLRTALHLYGIIEQIPQVIEVVSTALTKKVKTPVANYSIHQIAPQLFMDYQYYRQQGNFLIATPEKALFDCAYLSIRKGSRFSTLPELFLPKNFRRKKLREFVKKISYTRLQKKVWEQLNKWIKK